MTNTPIFCNCANNIQGMCYGANGATPFIDQVSRATDFSNPVIGNVFKATDCPGYKSPDQAPDQSRQGDMLIGPND